MSSQDIVDATTIIIIAGREDKLNIIGIYASNPVYHGKCFYHYSGILMKIVSCNRQLLELASCNG
ncbi:hypothetical protein N7517_002458 [Penicillium concentricum]|uniref:Uncharacterized protein n=1 Tax=Penicillium concentricum TaxID=293559 RepID=A0A9W9SU95_9EURO|nr:uncharacterized protein N7517_002458 [Penicillium concentricum]KAJ5384547.1 hypothetical protein N7517_002458 [Penicillium concentricum]